MRDITPVHAPDIASAETQSMLVLRHEPFEHLGHFEAVLKNRNISFFYSDLGDVPDLGTHDGVIVMGGPQSANDQEMAAEYHFIQQALDSKTPVLGICLGAQLIAKALGAHVYRNAEKEIGWAPVFFTDAAGDPIFSRFPSPSVFFHWHSETFMLPAGAVSLAYSDKCRQQAFRFHDTVYGIQFHPEITPEMIVDWSAQSVNCADADSLDVPLDPHAAETASSARQILEGWLNTFQTLAR
jgi:GMP synthase-like glutamine amidotransferase